MNIFAVINGINSLLSLGILIAILPRPSKTSLQKAYCLWTFLLFGWTSTYFVWGLQTNAKDSVFWLTLLMYPVCLIHVAWLHTALLFSESVSKNKTLLISAYILAIISAGINFLGGFVDPSNVRLKYGFVWPHGTQLLLVFIATQAICLGVAFYKIYKYSSETTNPARYRLKIFLTTSFIAWIGGLMNWFPWYDTFSIPPAGNLGVTFFMLISIYLIFKHDLLKLNLVIKRTFLYGALTLFITLTYLIFIMLAERFSRTYLGYSSLLASLLSALTIALLFNPARSFFSNILDKAFFGKRIEELSRENQHMLSQLEQQDRLRAVATFAAGTAHEIKNPLTVIKTFTENLALKYDDSVFREKFIRLMPNEVERMNNIVKQLLDFSKPQEPTLAPCSIRDIIVDTTHLVDDSMRKKGIRLEISAGEDANVIADKNQLKQVFLNILMNSIQSMPSGGLIRIGMTLLEGSVQVSILDTGPGIPASDLPHIFEPFFSKKDGGTGLGLSIVHSIITRHGGSIEVSSEVGKGTTFNVVLRS